MKSILETSHRLQSPERVKDEERLEAKRKKRKTRSDKTGQGDTAAKVWRMGMFADLTDGSDDSGCRPAPTAAKGTATAARRNKVAVTNGGVVELRGQNSATNAGFGLSGGPLGNGRVWRMVRQVGHLQSAPFSPIKRLVRITVELTDLFAVIVAPGWWRSVSGACSQSSFWCRSLWLRSLF
jgi:hypothetical protein